MPEIHELYAIKSPSQEVENTQSLYSEIRALQNMRFQECSVMWSTGDYRCSWKEKGEEHSEFGIGYLIVKSPNRIVCAFSKLGDPWFRFGRDGDVCWIIVKNTNNPSRATIIKDGFVIPQNPDAILLPCEPSDLTFALGIFELPPPDDSRWSLRGDLYQNANTLCLQDQEYERRVSFDKSSNLPVRIELVSRKTGLPVISSSLRRYYDMSLDRKGEQRVWFPQQIQVTSESSGFELNIKTLSVSNSAAHGAPIKDDFFDFYNSCKSMGITPDQVKSFGIEMVPVNAAP